MFQKSLAAAAGICKAASDESYAVALARKAELDDLLRGQPMTDETARAPFKWSDLATRSLLMQRMETGIADRVDAVLADVRTFRRGRDEVRHEAQLLAVLAEVITREDYEFWDDESYVGYAAELRNAAIGLGTAVEEQDFAAARAALARAHQSCAVCHDGYR